MQSKKKDKAEVIHNYLDFMMFVKKHLEKYEGKTATIANKEISKYRVSTQVMKALESFSMIQMKKIGRILYYTWIAEEDYEITPQLAEMLYTATKSFQREVGRVYKNNVKLKKQKKTLPEAKSEPKPEYAIKAEVEVEEPKVEEVKKSLTKPVKFNPAGVKAIVPRGTAFTKEQLATLGNIRVKGYVRINEFFFSGVTEISFKTSTSDLRIILTSDETSSIVAEVFAKHDIYIYVYGSTYEINISV